MQWNVEIIESEHLIKAIVKVDETLNDIKSLEPTGQILVDSEGQDFVYILDGEDGYNHLRFSKNVWGFLEEKRKEEQPIYVKFFHNEEKHQIELKNFWTELNTLIENIQGNSNYGKDMVQAVEATFKK